MDLAGLKIVLSSAAGEVVEMDAAHIEIPIVGGARSPRASFTTSNAAGRKLDSWSAASRANVALTVTGEYWDGAVRSIAQRFRGLRLLEKAEAPDPFNTTWIMGDKRYPWERRKGFYRFNTTRRANAATVAPGAAGPAVDWDVVLKWRYLPGHLKKKGKNEFNATRQREDPYAGAEPWTALSAVRLVLRDLGVEDSELDVDVEDNGVIIENLMFNGDSMPSILGTLLGHARAGIAWLPQEERFVVYPVAISAPAVKQHGAELFAAIPLFEGGGNWPMVQDLRGMAPELYRFYVEEDYEIRFEYSEGQVSKTALDFTLENVVKLPENLTYQGKEYVRGTYVPIEDAIDMWYADEAPATEVSLAKLRKSFFTGDLQSFFADYLRSDANDKWRKRVDLLFSSYRRVFRIRPEWMDRIEAWQPGLSSVADPVTGHRIRSPVIMDYVIRPTIRGSKGEKQREDGLSKAGLQVTNWFSAIEDVKDGPFWIKIVDHDLGVFAIEQFHDLEALEEWYYPGVVDNIPSLRIGANATNWLGAELSSTFKLDVILSCIFSEPADLSRFRVFERQAGIGRGGSRAQGNGVTQDVFINEDRARYKWTNSARATIDEKGRLRVLGADLQPHARATLNAVVSALQHRLDETWSERVQGRFTVPGFDPRLHRPIGPLHSVIFTFDAATGPTTTLTISDRTPPPSLREKLPQEIKRFVFHELARESLGQKGGGG